jgi:exopolyphosphatase/guanosine-5'-triphosphate,3'-diphosphate pyrophosphatase
LLVAEPADGGFRVIDAFSRIVRLGEGLSCSGRLSDAAMGRALRALEICADKMRRRGVTHARAVATEACRRAENAAVFVGRVRNATGIEMEIISQEEEARLALHGCAPLLDCAIPNALIFDIGGGSTEVSWLTTPGAKAQAEANGTVAPDLVAWYSMPIGVVGLAERHGGRDITPAQYAAMVDESREALAPFAARPEVRDVLSEGRVQMLGTSGTVTTLAGVYQGLPRYDRKRVDGCYMGFDTVQAVSRRIAAMSYGERSRHPCIGDQRADLVIAGCAILEAICRTWPVGRLRVADRGLREGILAELMRASPTRPCNETEEDGQPGPRQSP